MKSIIKFACLYFIFTCALLICLDFETQTQRASELEDAVSISMRNVLKASTYAPLYEMKSNDMSSEFIRNFAQNINGDGTFVVTIKEADKLGILDVKVKESFIHNNGHAGEKTLRRTMVVEQYEP